MKQKNDAKPENSFPNVGLPQYRAKYGASEI